MPESTRLDAFRRRAAAVRAASASKPGRGTDSARTIREERDAAGRDKPSDSRVYQLRIALADIRPEIWRRVQVSSGVSLRKLHDVLQAAMGWTNSHLHRFEAGGREFGRTDPDLDLEDDLISDQQATLAEIAPAVGSRFVYEYDFGDGWEHSVLVEDVREGGVAVGR